MRLQIISDLHFEFGKSDIPFDNADIVVLAGDIHIGTKGIEWILSTIKNKPVIYVLGNHEYYKGSYPRTLHKISELSLNTNVHVLENRSVTIDGICFHGATLWTDFSLFGSPLHYGSICQSKMNDYKKIRRDPSYSALRTIDTFRIHNKSMHWLEETLTNSKAKTNVVVTHHAPSLQSIPIRYREDPVSSAYASDLEAFIRTHQPQLWIHGHVHEPKQYTIGETKVICNPHGYIDEPYNGYTKELILIID